MKPNSVSHFVFRPFAFHIMRYASRKFSGDCGRRIQNPHCLWERKSSKKDLMFSNRPTKIVSHAGKHSPLLDHPSGFAKLDGASSTVGLSRRRFLSRLLRMGAYGLPIVASSRILGRAGQVAPNSRIVFGCIGVGGQGTRHIAGGVWVPQGGLLGRSDVQVVAVCDVNEHHLRRAQQIVNQRYGNQDCRAYRDFRDLLARPDIDAVLLATGERWHPLLSIAAARAGKDIYCEKPLSLTIREALVVREEIHRHGVIFQMGTQQRSSSAFRFACELVRNGYIGQVQEVVVGVGGPPPYRECTLPPEPEPPWLDYDMWLGPIPWRPYNHAFVQGWMAYRDCSGGEMTNWGAHHFDIAQWGLGMDDSGPIEVIPPDGKTYKVLTYRYANGVQVTRDPDRLQRETSHNNGVLFIGSEGKVAVWRYDLKTWPSYLRRVRLKPTDIHLHESYNHHTDFIRSIRMRTPPAAPVDVGARSITVCHLGNIAYELGRPVRWDPVREQFVQDPEAERLFYRPMRSPWRLG